MSNMKKIKMPLVLMLVFSVAITMVFAAGCKETAAAETAAAETAAAETAAAEKELFFGLSTQGIDEVFMIILVEGAQKKADELGVKLAAGDAEFLMEKQMEQSESFIMQGVDVLILQALDMSGGAPIAVLAEEAGVPVIAVCTTITNMDKTEGFVGSDDVFAGRIQAEYMIEKLGEEVKVAYIRGPLGSSAEINRTKGFMDVIKDYPGIEIVSDAPADWSRDEALAHVENWLVSGREFDAVIAHDDGMAIGASIAVIEAGKKDEIFIMGIDGVRDGLEAVQSGAIDGSAFQDAYYQGYYSVEWAYNLVTGGPFPASKTDYFAHPIEMIIPFELITPENVDDYVARIDSY